MHNLKDYFSTILLGCVWIHGYPWMEHGYPWIQGVWLDEQAEPRYPQQGIFWVDAGYPGPQKSGG